MNSVDTMDDELVDKWADEMGLMKAAEKVVVMVASMVALSVLQKVDMKAAWLDTC